MMKMWMQRVEKAQGYNRGAGGEPHGFRWVPEWEVTVTFDSEAKAKAFMADMEEIGRKE